MQPGLTWYLFRDFGNHRGGNFIASQLAVVLTARNTTEAWAKAAKWGFARRADAGMTITTLTDTHNPMRIDALKILVGASPLRPGYPRQLLRVEPDGNETMWPPVP